MGRPPEPVPQDIADALCGWIAQGKTLREFCRQPGMPARRTVDDWRDKDPDFAARVARARDTGFDMIAEEMLAIADTPQSGEIVTQDKDGKTVVTEDMLGHRKLQVETRAKLLACWDPRRYGPNAMNVKLEQHNTHVQLVLATGLPCNAEPLKPAELASPAGQGVVVPLPSTPAQAPNA
jgi:hypothetical protein